MSRILEAVAGGFRIFVCLLLVAATASAKTPVEEAREHFMKGTRLFNLTKYDEAIAEYEAGYSLKDDPVFLYNIAQAHRLAGHLDRAIRFYRNYLRLVPESAQRPEIERRIGDMEKALETQRNQQGVPPIGVMPPGREPGEIAPPPPVSAPSAPAPVEKPPVTYPGTLPAQEAARQPAAVPSPAVEAATPKVTRVVAPGRGPTADHHLNRTMMKWSGLGLIAGGALIAIAGGVGFGVAADGKASAIADEGATQMRFDPSLDSARTTYQALSIASYIVGGVAAAAGSVLLILWSRSGRAEAPRAPLEVAPTVGRGATGLSLSGVF